MQPRNLALMFVEQLGRDFFDQRVPDAEGDVVEVRLERVSLYRRRVTDTTLGCGTQIATHHKHVNGVSLNTLYVETQGLQIAEPVTSSA